MSPGTNQLLNAALTLPFQERLDLAEAIMDSVEPENRPVLREEWHSILRQRSAELASGKVTPVAWEVVEQRIDAGERLGG